MNVPNSRLFISYFSRKPRSFIAFAVPMAIGGNGRSVLNNSGANSCAKERISSNRSLVSMVFLDDMLCL